MSSRPEFDRLMLELDYPMFIVTARVGDECGGCLIGFATQASIEPGRFLACLSIKNHTYELALRSSHLAVHCVPEGALEVAELFGGETGHEVDKLARVDHSDGPHELPILAACDNWFVGAVIHRVPFGDHVGFLLEPEAVHAGSAEGQFTFHRAKRIQPGHEP